MAHTRTKKLHERSCLLPVFSLDACVQGFRDEWTYVSVAGDQSFISLMTQKSEQC